MPRKLFGKAFWHNFKFKYKISILNESTLEEVVSLRVSKMNGLSVLLTVVIFLFVVIGSILIFTPLRNYLPGYMNSELRSQVVENALKVDSLVTAMNMQEAYVANIKSVFKGEIKVDTTMNIDELTVIREDLLIKPTEREEKFRRQYEEAEKYNLTTINAQVEADGLLFYTPTRGIITSRYDVNIGHYAIDIAANPNESVLSVLDGIVILSTYTADTGYVIGVQHNQEFISFYKHCGALLKRQGEQVKAGEVIALVGSTGTLTTGPHLHLELWHKGKAVNPESFIVF